MTNKEIVNLYNELDSLRTKKLPIVVSFAVNRNLKKMKDIADEIESSRIDVIKEYAEKNDDGEVKTNDNGQATIPEEKVDAFNKDFDSLMNINTDIDLETITMTDIEKCDLDRYDSLTVDEFGILEKLVAKTE